MSTTFFDFFYLFSLFGFFCFFYLFRRAFQRGCDLRLPKYFPVPAARRRDVIPANNITNASLSRHASNKIPYSALPKGCEHVDTVSVIAITFPIRFRGVAI